MGSRWNAVNSASYSTVGLELVLSILLGFFGGRWLDGKLGTEPWLAFFGLACGLVAGFRALYRAHQRMQRDAERDGFREASTGRDARFALEQKKDEG